MGVTVKNDDIISVATAVPEEEPAYEPNADMKWAKALLDSDVNTNDSNMDEHKMIQYFAANVGDISIIQIDKGKAVKTCDGTYYDNTAGTEEISVEHIWSTNLHQSLVENNSLAWYIYYSNNVSLFDYSYYNSWAYQNNVKYICYKNIYVSADFGHGYGLGLSLLQYFDSIGGFREVYSGPNTSFRLCSSLEALPEGFQIKTTSYDGYSDMFYGCTSLRSIKGLTFKNYRFINCFYGCSSLRDASQITQITGDCSGMFNGCTQLEKIASEIDCSGCTNLSYAFSNTNIKEIKLKNTNSVSDISRMCQDNFNLEKITFPEYEQIIITDSAFRNCKRLKNIPFSNLPSVTSAFYMFSNCVGLHDVNIQLNLPECTNMYCMLEYTPITSVLIYAPLVNRADNICYSCEFLQSFEFNGTMTLQTSYNLDSAFVYGWALRNVNITNINTTISFSYSSRLTVSSLLSILNSLTDKTGTKSQTLTLGSTNLAKLTAEEIALGTAKGWIIN